MVQGESSGADEVQNVTPVMGGKIDMMNEVEAVEYLGEFSGYCGVHVDVKISKEEDSKKINPGQRQTFHGRLSVRELLSSSGERAGRKKPGGSSIEPLRAGGQRK